MGFFDHFGHLRPNKKFAKKYPVTFSTWGQVCLHFSLIRSPQRTCSLRESRLTVGSAEGAGAIGGLAPAPFVLRHTHVNCFSHTRRVNKFLESSMSLHSRSYF
jgi:hypothetical protein